MKRFQRRLEDFSCEHCGVEVTGSGYTNHCSKCLWSKHVDVNPGDRAEACLGMMEPIRLEGTTDAYRIVHTCTRCGLERRNDVAKNDDSDTLVALASKKH
ncbi:MAG: RNHCP domain-containing protein [bacterium]|nr:RNHCP domain-containing protein [bacterium]